MDNVLNLFQQAKEVAPTKPATNGNGGNGIKGKNVVELGEDLSTLASIKVLVKSLEDLAKVYDEKVKLQMADEFAKVACETGKRPANFKGVSLKAEASCELRKRSTSSYLNDEELALLSAMDIPVGELIIQEEVPERYFFNTAIVANADLASKISVALSTIEELKGMDVILRQPAEPAEVRKYVPDEALDAVAATRDLGMIKELLPIVSSLAIRVKLSSAEIGNALNLIKNAEISL